MSAAAARRRSGQSGFTLIEIMVTLVVFGVGMLALAAVIPLAVKKNDSAAQQSRASELAAAVAERLLDTPYLELSAGETQDSSNPYYGRYYVKWNVEDDQPLKSSRRITVSVHFKAITAPILAKLVVVSCETGG